MRKNGDLIVGRVVSHNEGWWHDRNGKAGSSAYLTRTSYDADR